jgi:hypothetical protein
VDVVFIPGRCKGLFFLLSTSSTPALGPTHPPVKWLPRALSPGIKRMGHEAHHSCPSSAESKATNNQSTNQPGSVFSAAISGWTATEMNALPVSSYDVTQELFPSVHQLAALRASDSRAVRFSEASCTIVCVRGTRGPQTMAGSILPLLLVVILPAVHPLPPRVPIGEYCTMYQLLKLGDGRLKKQDVRIGPALWHKHEAQ